MKLFVILKEDDYNNTQIELFENKESAISEFVRLTQYDGDSASIEEKLELTGAAVKNVVGSFGVITRYTLKVADVIEG